MKQQTVLIILDGWGYREDTLHNAIAAAKTPVFDKLWHEFPHTLLEASGLAVGLPAGQMGNSEIGHMTIGAGKSLDTDLVRIGKAIERDEFVTNAAFVRMFEHVKQHDSTLHVMGLVSAGGVHSHHEHLFAFLRAAKRAGITKIAVHAFTDGRDTAPQSAAGYLKELEAVLAEVGIAKIASVSGRFYAMDRDNNWDRLARVEDALFECKGNVCQAKMPSEMVAALHAEGKLDEHFEPMVFLDDTGKGYPVQKNDAVFFFNFRADRARMLSKKIAERRERDNLYFATLTEYESGLGADIAFPALAIETVLAAEIANAGLTQAHIAETEKFPHATYFLNGGREKPHVGEVHELIPSRKDVPTHDLAPKMRAKEIADKAIEHIEHGTDFIFINFANPDMVGHTANVPAIVEALEEVDMHLGRVIDALSARGGVAFVTADHGNAEVNVDIATGEKHTAHTINPVPAIVTKNDLTLAAGGDLTDIAPTILGLMNLPKPASMTGENLVE